MALLRLNRSGICETFKGFLFILEPWDSEQQPFRHVIYPREVGGEYNWTLLYACLEGLMSRKPQMGWDILCMKVDWQHLWKLVIRSAYQALLCTAFRLLGTDLQMESFHPVSLNPVCVSCVPFPSWQCDWIGVSLLRLVDNLLLLRSVYSFFYFYF